MWKGSVCRSEVLTGWSLRRQGLRTSNVLCSVWSWPKAGPGEGGGAGRGLCGGWAVSSSDLGGRGAGTPPPVVRLHLHSP
jgi:hypothetical protein